MSNDEGLLYIKKIYFSLTAFSISLIKSNFSHKCVALSCLKGGCNKRVNQIIFNESNKMIVCMKTADCLWNKQNG